MRRNEGCQCTAPSWLHAHVWAALRTGLDSALLAASARPTEQAAQTFIIVLLA
jgi:hypothetical protein